MSVHVTWCFPLLFCQASPEFTSCSQLWPWWVNQKVSDTNYQSVFSEHTVASTITLEPLSSNPQEHSHGLAYCSLPFTQHSNWPTVGAVVVELNLVRFISQARFLVSSSVVPSLEQTLGEGTDERMNAQIREGWTYKDKKVNKSHTRFVIRVPISQIMIVETNTQGAS